RRRRRTRDETACRGGARVRGVRRRRLSRSRRRAPRRRAPRGADRCRGRFLDRAPLGNRCGRRGGGAARGVEGAGGRMKVIVTRPRAQAGPLVDRLEELGYEVVECPLIEIERTSDEPIDCSGYEWAVVTSPNGADDVPLYRPVLLRPEAPQGDVVVLASGSAARAYAWTGGKAPAVSIGPETSRVAESVGLEVAVEADAHDLDGLVAAVEKFARGHE